jgi:glucose-6-phosphate-specific signal transduction histidine kinase
MSLYATLVCVACSQLEKLRAALLDIRQTHVISQQDCGTESDQQEAQARISKEQFRHMQEQLNNCIRHHQEIKWYSKS